MARVNRRQDIRALLADGIANHPAGSPGADAVVEAIVFHRARNRTFTEDVGHDPTRFTAAVFELPAVEFARVIAVHQSSSIFVNDV